MNKHFTQTNIPKDFLIQYQVIGIDLVRRKNFTAVKFRESFECLKILSFYLAAL